MAEICDFGRYKRYTPPLGGVPNVPNAMRRVFYLPIFEWVVIIITSSSSPWMTSLWKLSAGVLLAPADLFVDNAPLAYFLRQPIFLWIMRHDQRMARR